jgi:hypothetical protein
MRERASCELFSCRFGWPFFGAISRKLSRASSSKTSVELVRAFNVLGLGHRNPFPRTWWLALQLGCLCGSPLLSSIRPMSETALSIMTRSPDERSERLLQRQQEGAIAFAEYQRKEQATRLLTAKLRAERLARESQPRRKRKAKSGITVTHD